MSVITIPYKPRDQQMEVHDLCASHRFGVVVAHRRFGKSVLSFNDMQRDALSMNPDERPNYRAAFIGPTYTQAKSILWDHARHYSAVVPGVKYNESELRIDYPTGARLRIFGGDNPDSLRGMYFDLVVFDEFDLQKMAMWTEVVRPAIADRRGRAYFIGTFKYVDGPLGQIFDLAQGDPDWFVKVYKASETKILGELRSRQEIDAMRELARKSGAPLPQLSELEAAREVMSEEEFNREFECVRSAAVRGAIFGRLVDEADAEGRIRETIPVDPAIPVTTAWDLGVGDSTAIWFVQQVGSEVRLVDYYEGSGEGLAHYARVLQEKKYIYREHIAPHDIGVRELGTGKSRLELAAGLGIFFRVLPRISQTVRSEIDERIEAGRMLLPRCYFDRVRCKHGIDALRSWRREENAKTGELRSQPIHDWASHGSDAFTYLAMGLRQVAKVNRSQPSVRWVV